MTPTLKLGPDAQKRWCLNVPSVEFRPIAVMGGAARCSSYSRRSCTGHRSNSLSLSIDPGLVHAGPVRNGDVRGSGTEKAEPAPMRLNRQFRHTWP
jgi:hypothetical protein